MSAHLDRLAALARQDAPAPLDANQAARVVAAALHGASVRLPQRRRARRVVAAVAGLTLLTAAAAALLLLRPGGTPPTQAPTRAAAAAPLHFGLPSGDRVTATAGAQVQVASLDPRARRLVLADGTALFDVAPLGRGTSFEVATAHARVAVRGTVFSVTTTRARTVVRVYEGHVRVTAAGRVVELDAGQTWASDGPSGDADPLGDEASAAAAARVARAPRVTALPEVQPLAETEEKEEDTPRHPPATIPAPRVAAETAADADANAEAAELAEVRGWISIGAAERARTVAHERAGDASSSRPGAWRLIEADALRALARHAEAADVYDAAAQRLPARQAAQAGYLAASLRFERGGDARGALASLDAVAADAPGAPLEERALALRARALADLGRDDEARVTARRYLERFPEGGQAAALRGLAAGP